MNRFFQITLIAGIALAIGTDRVCAQYANEFSEAKLINQGKTTHSIAGNGKVVVQVQVNADGSHKAIKVISSTNPGDNAAAMDIAQNSTYRPAHRGKTPITAFYDFTLRLQRQVRSEQCQRRERRRGSACRRLALAGRRFGSRSRSAGAVRTSKIQSAGRAAQHAGRRVAPPNVGHRGVRRRRLCGRCIGLR